MSKLLAVAIALGVAVGFAAPVFAADKMPTTKSACEKDHMKWDATTHMKWDATTKTCSKANM